MLNLILNCSPFTQTYHFKLEIDIHLSDLRTEAKWCKVVRTTLHHHVVTLKWCKVVRTTDHTTKVVDLKWCKVVRTTDHTT